MENDLLQFTAWLVKQRHDILLLSPQSIVGEYMNYRRQEDINDFMVATIAMFQGKQDEMHFSVAGTQYSLFKGNIQILSEEDEDEADEDC